MSHPVSSQSSCPKSQRTPPSKQLVQCKRCKLKPKWQNMEGHYETAHKDYNFMECLVVSDKQSIETLFKRQLSSTSTNSDDHDGEPNEKVQRLGSDVSEQISPQLSAELKALKDGQVEILRLLNTNKSTTATVTSVGSVSADKSHVSSIDKAGSDAYLSTVIKNAKTVDQIVTSLDCIIYSEDGQYVHYFLCSKAMSNTESQSTETESESSDIDSNIPKFISSKGWFHIPRPSEKSEKSDFYHLKDHIKRHLISNDHKYNEHKSKPETVKKQKRDYDIGMRLGSLAYEIVYRAQAFRSFPEKVAWLSTTGVDVGSTNHSKTFITDMVPNFVKAINERLQALVSEPLACTGKLRPIGISSDKCKSKNDELHGIVARIPIYKQDRLFSTFLLGQPVQVSGTRIALTDAIMKEVSTVLGLPADKFRLRFVGYVADGGIVHNLRMYKAIAENLDIDERYAEDIVIWDNAHKIELVAEDTKKRTHWLQTHDSLLQSTMKDMQAIHTRDKLITMCEKLDTKFYEVHLFSDTRFAQYAHRTYKNLRQQYIPYYKLLQEIAASDTNDAVDAQALLRKYQDPHYILRLIFLEEVFNLVAVISKDTQSDDVFPFHPKKSIELLASQLSSACTDFERLQCPAECSVTEDLTLWKMLSECVKEISDKGEWSGCALLIPEPRGRHQNREVPVDNTTALIEKCYKQFQKYLKDFTDILKDRFKWPEWLIQCEKVFDFSLNISDTDRKSALIKLIEQPSSPYPLTSDDKKRISAEYVTLLTRAKQAMENEDFTKQEKLHYYICTNPELYEDCQHIIDYSLRFLARPTNECVVESVFSILNRVNDEKRPLNHKTLVNICMIRQNGPHPLASKALVKSALDMHFGEKPWHFCTNSEKFYVSKTVQSLVSEAKKHYSLFND